MGRNTAVINGIEHEDIIYDDPDDCIQYEKVEDNPQMIIASEDKHTVEGDDEYIEPSEEIKPVPEESEYEKLDKLIEDLPEQFPAAEEKIKCEIAPHLVECNPGVKDHYIKIIKKRTNAASIKSVSLLIDEVIKKMKENNSDIDENPSNNTIIDPEIIEAAEQIAQDPMLFKNKIDLVNKLGVINERKNIGLYNLIIDSRLLPMGRAGSDALAMKNSGHYGAGKSYPLFMTLKLYPKKAYHLISSASDKSLYQIEGGLKYKALILAEALALESHGKKDNELAYAIRTLVSEGHLKYQYTGFKDKKRVTLVKKIAGPTSLLTTTIKGKLEDQLDDRMFTAHPNTTTEQTVNIIEQTAATAGGIGNQIDEKILKAYQRYHDSLLSVEVVIPFAENIAIIVSQKGPLPISARRSFKRVLAAIKTITILYQKQRSRDEQGRVISEYCDYALAYQLVGDAYMESIGNAGKYTDQRFKIIEKNGKITPKALAKVIGITGSAISQWMKPLLKKGVLMWVDDADTTFADVNSLEKAKRSGKAYIKVGQYNRLPTPFELTGNPDWDRGGVLLGAYDLHLDDIVDDFIDSDKVEKDCQEQEDADLTDEGVKVISEKTNDDIKKMMKTFRENQEKWEPDETEVMELANEFGDILSIDNVAVI